MVFSMGGEQYDYRLSEAADGDTTLKENNIPCNA
jgi:hypothetical protein